MCLNGSTTPCSRACIWHLFHNSLFRKRSSTYSASVRRFECTVRRRTVADGSFGGSGSSVGALALSRWWFSFDLPTRTLVENPLLIIRQREGLMHRTFTVLALTACAALSASAEGTNRDLRPPHTKDARVYVTLENKSSWFRDVTID